MSNIFTNLKCEIGPYANEVFVERGVMQCTQRQPISYQRFSGRFNIGNYVRCIEQFLVAKSTESTLDLVCG
jgi:hypothetical protein